jgi:hypothetical protein
LDCIEHVLSRHPRASRPKPPSPVAMPGSVQWMGNPIKRKKKREPADTHLGGQ